MRSGYSRVDLEDLYHLRFKVFLPQKFPDLDERETGFEQILAQHTPVSARGRDFSDGANPESFRVGGPSAALDCPSCEETRHCIPHSDRCPGPN
jgi:hypothetical protein